MRPWIHELTIRYPSCYKILDNQFPDCLVAKPSSKPQRSALQLIFYDFAWLGRLPWRLCEGQLYRRDSGGDSSATHPIRKRLEEGRSEEREREREEKQSPE